MITINTHVGRFKSGVDARVTQLGEAPRLKQQPDTSIPILTVTMLQISDHNHFQREESDLFSNNSY